MSTPPRNMKAWSNDLDVIAPIARTRGHELNLDALVGTVVDAHAGQVRDGSEVPYVIHPMRTALSLVALFPDGFGTVPAADMFATGLAHDVLEEAPDFADTLRMGTNSLVFDAIFQLTKPPGIDKVTYLQNLVTAPSWIRAVKCEDRVDNLISMIASVGDGVIGHERLQHYALQSKRYVVPLARDLLECESRLLSVLARAEGILVHRGVST